MHIFKLKIIQNKEKPGFEDFHGSYFREPCSLFLTDSSVYSLETNVKKLYKVLVHSPFNFTLKSRISEICYGPFFFVSIALDAYVAR